MSESTILQLVLTGVSIVAVFWLLVLPYWIAKGLLHKWGYHARCSLGCEVKQSAENIKALLTERYKAGMRQGMRGRATFGASDSDKMVTKHSLLPDWTPNPGDDEFSAAVKAKYHELRFAFDVADDINTARVALSVALGLSLRQMADPPVAYERSVGLVAQYAGLEPATTTQTVPSADAG